MSTDGRREAPWRGVELLERAIAYTRGCLSLVTPDRMVAPTPCAAWDLAQLLAHMEDSLASLHEAGSVRRVALAVGTGAHTDPVDRLRQRACQVLADWSGEGAPGPLPRRDVLVAGRPLTSNVLTSAGALEIAVHGWDVAAACGAPRALPDSLATELLRVAPVIVTPEDRPARFGAVLAPDGDAGPGERLLGFLGRATR